MSSRALNKILVMVLIFLTMHLYFFSEIVSFFSQDDFFHLSTVTNKKFGDIPSFFYKLSQEYAFYRPISRESYSFIALKFFGLNPLPYHFINLTLIIINGFLGIKFLTLLNEHFNKIVFKSLFLFLYLFSSIHSVELYYLSSVQTLMAATFILFSLIFFLKNRLYSLMFFILALMSHESSFVFLPISFLLVFFGIEEKFIQKIKIAITNLLPFILIFLIRVLIHFYGFGLDNTNVYIPNFSLQTVLNTALWYLLWSFGMPEMLVDFATLRLQFNPNLFKYYEEFTKIVFPSFLLVIITLILIISKVKKILLRNNFIFLLLSFFSSLLPLIFFPSHKFIYYLSFPMVLFAGILSLIFFEFLKQDTKLRVLIFIFLGLYLLISFQTVKVNKVTYWAAKRAKSAQFILKDIKSRFPVLEKGSIIFIKDDPNYPFIAKEWGTSSKQAFYILSGSDAFKLVYKDPTIKTYYEAIGTPPKDSLINLVVYEARFPY